MVDRHNRSIVQYPLRLSSNGTGRRNNKIGLYDRGSLPFRCGLLRPERKGPTGGWVERRAKKPTLIQSFHLPYKIDLSEAQSAMILRGRAEFDRGAQGFTPLPWESEGGWARTP